MARTEITVTQIVRSGATQTPTDGNADGHMFANTGKEFIRVTNSALTSRDLTVITQQQIDGLDVADLVVSIPAGESRLVGPFSPGTFNVPSGQTDAGKTYIDYPSGNESDLKVEIYKL